MNLEKNKNTVKQRYSKVAFLLIIVTTIFLAGCSNGKLFHKKNDCGCPNKKGMVGY